MQSSSWPTLTASTGAMPRPKRFSHGGVNRLHIRGLFCPDRPFKKGTDGSVLMNFWR
jgi:hypothetical protein